MRMRKKIDFSRLFLYFVFFVAALCLYFLLDNGVMLQKWVPVALGFLPDANDVAEYIEKNSYSPEFIVMIKGATEPTVLKYDGELWSCDLGQTYNVTHWMPLPEPPKEEK